MSQLPSVASFLADNTEAQQKVYFQQLLEATAQLPGGSTAVDAGIVSGTISPANGQNTFMVDTEGQSASDILNNISVSNLPDGSIIMLVAKNAGRVVTVNHANGGSGQIITMLGKDFNLETDRFVLLKLFGTSWYEFGGAPVEDATDLVKGVVELATDTETQTGADNTRAVTPAGLQSCTATTERKGIIEIATTAEADAGTDTTKAVTPAGVKSAVKKYGFGDAFSSTTLSEGATYTNTSSYSIGVMVRIYSSNSARYTTAKVNGVLVGKASGTDYQLVMIVPPGGTYQIEFSGAGPMIASCGRVL